MSAEFTDRHGQTESSSLSACRSLRSKMEFVPFDRWICNNKVSITLNLCADWVVSLPVYKVVHVVLWCGETGICISAGAKQKLQNKSKSSWMTKGCNPSYNSLLLILQIIPPFKTILHADHDRTADFRTTQDKVEDFSCNLWCWNNFSCCNPENIINPY